MENKLKSKPSFKAGMYLLENLTSGMYTDPLAILREYIQNGVDSIDLSGYEETSNHLEIRINLDPGERNISIWDNGQGIPSAFAEEILSSIGSSNKTNPKLRGFRGIGRLGGIAFCDKAVFRTKAKHERVESIQEWDCNKLRKLLVDNRSLTFDELFQEITSFNHKNSRRPEESYFEVTLFAVSSFRNYIFDITRARRYLSRVAPVPFHPDFSYAQEIDDYLNQKLKHYRRYNVFLNGERIYKPYRDRIKITKGGFDEIKSINFYELRSGQDEMIGCGWHGQRKEMSGSIVKGDDSSGIRVRVGNILIGDEHLIDGCFREPRFNSYVIGEIHIDNDKLIPNSRRDDFIDNKSKSVFYNSIERNIGLPISKEIRLRSKIRSESRVKKITPMGTKEDRSREASKVIYKESKPAEEKGTSVKTSENHSKRRIFEEILKECNGCPKVAGILDKL